MSCFGRGCLRSVTTHYNDLGQDDKNYMINLKQSLNKFEKLHPI